MRTGIHAANPETSRRLKRVLNWLKDKGTLGATTRELIDGTGFCAINSIVSELRASGISVDCRCEGVSGEGARIYRYTLGVSD